MRSRSIGLWGLVCLGSLAGVALCLLAWQWPEWLGVRPGSSELLRWLSGAFGLTLLGMSSVGAFLLLAGSVGASSFLHQRGDDRPSEKPATEADSSWSTSRFASLKPYMRENYGRRWRSKVRVLLVVGDAPQVDSLIPGLTHQAWLEGQGTVLLSGGDLRSAWSQELLACLRELGWGHSRDGIVWALDETTIEDVAWLSKHARHLRGLARELHWSAPLYLWQVCSSGWAQTGRDSQTVGCLFPPRASLATVELSLRQLLEPLRERGFAQLSVQASHDFLLRLSRDLGARGISRWRDALAPILGHVNGAIPLRGLFFSPPLTAPLIESERIWWPDAAWEGVLNDAQSQVQPVGWTWLRGLRAGALCLAGLFALALLLSFTSNRNQIATVESALATLNAPGDADAQLRALHELTREMSRLDYRREHGEPWYLRFGLSQNDALLAVLWPRYTQINNRLMRDVAAKHLEQQLAAFVALPAGSPERAARAAEAHAQLKAYLMMARPEKADPQFLTRVLAGEQAERPGVTPGLWQALSPNLWAFYAQHLAAHPDWRTETQPSLVAQARQVLLGQLGQRNGMATLYQQVIDRASNHFAAMTLQDMVGETDAATLFDTPNSVPGVFTRQAWENQVSKAIDEVAEARREEIDWVLSDQKGTLDSELQPEVLKARLTERYFQAFSDAWLTFLNSIRWRKADNLSDAISQLTLLSDVRQSPLIALMNTLAYQGKTETRGEALSDSLMKSAQQLLDRDKQPMIDQQAAGPRGPLDATFGPVLALLGKDKSVAATGDNLSLQAFLTRVTRVRLKLQQITTASDPQAMTQALAQTVFQGKSVDLTDTLDYGSLIAASLGAQWNGFGHNLFVQPLNQAWEGVLQPAALSLNRQWQRAIVGNWQRAFEGRYPFAATGSDASLPMLGQMIRGDTGRIDQFISSQLGGVLRKEGNRWVPDSGNSQGLRFNPQFLEAVNQLSDLADILYTDGGMGMSFELRAKPVRSVVETTLILDGVTLEYFNQMESWKPFNWPGGTYRPGVSLSWTSLKGGARLFADHSGTWGLIRLLEQARVTALDSSDTLFELVLTAPDKLPLTWHLRTELGNGPLALLQLRGFSLPLTIFEVGEGQSLPYANLDAFEHLPHMNGFRMRP